MQKNKKRRMTMGRKITVLFFSGFFTFAVLSMGNGPVNAAETFTLKAVTAWPKTASEFKAFTILTDLVDQMIAKKAPGELKIQYIGGPEAVKTPDQVPALQRGMVDMVYTSGAYYTNVLP